MKRVVIEMINEELAGGSNAEVGIQLGDFIGQSLRWWHDHLDEGDRLRLAKWRIESIKVKDNPPAQQCS
ncbi:MAG: hypothetical protein QF619_03335 [Candidatus Binatia bacterium]|jgi:hypothetical protein|nr:hypothetical protein [Candidatus Binatia bacterium]